MFCFNRLLCTGSIAESFGTPRFFSGQHALFSAKAITQGSHISDGKPVRHGRMSLKEKEERACERYFTRAKPLPKETN